MKECRNRSEDIRNEKRGKFLIDMDIHFFPQLSKNIFLDRFWKKKCWILVPFGFLVRVSIVNPIRIYYRNPYQNRFETQLYFQNDVNIFRIGVEKKVGVQFRIRKIIAFDWWGIQSDSCTPSYSLEQFCSEKWKMSVFFP